MPIKIVRNDITKMCCDAIVNPTNEDLFPSGGTDAAIHIAAGSKLLADCKKIGYCNVGDAKITPAYDLPAKYVVHTVGPVWEGGERGEHSKLEACYRNSLSLAKAHKCQSIAFPLISSGLYGYPKDKVLKVAVGAVSEFLADNDMEVFIVVYDKESYRISEKIFSGVKAFIDDNYTDIEKHSVACREETSAPMYRARPMPRIAESIAYQNIERAPKKAPEPKKSLEEMLNSLDESFAEMLFRLIDAKGMTDVECYKRANVDKKTFSKIKCNKSYRPSKVTAVSFAIALELTLEETNALLRTVGMSLSRSNKFDVIIEFFITNGIYDIYEINETLFQFDQLLLGA